MSKEICNECRKKVLSKEKGLCCDLCERWYHTGCLGINDEDYKKIVQLGDLVFWLCDNDKKKHIDWKNHETSEKEIARKIELMENEVKEIRKTIDRNSTTPSYANVLKTAPTKSSFLTPNKSCGLLVYPKDKTKTSTNTEDEIKENINLSQIKVGVTSLKPIKGGGIYLSTEDENGVKILKEELVKQLGSGFETKLPKTLAPKVIISGITKKYEEDTLLEELIATNPRLNDNDRREIKIVHHFNRKGKRGDQNWSYILETNGKVFSKIVNNYILLDYNYHFVKEYLSVLRCFRCQGYNHKGSNCPNEFEICSYCSGHHDSRKCDQGNNKICINCKAANEKGEFRYDIKHSSGSSECKIQMMFMSRSRDKINYKIESIC